LQWITARRTPKAHQCDATRRGGQGRRSAWRRPRPAVPVSRFRSVRAPGLARSVFGLRRPASGQSTRRRPPAADQKSRPTPTASLAAAGGRRQEQRTPGAHLRYLRQRPTRASWWTARVPPPAEGPDLHAGRRPAAPTTEPRESASRHQPVVVGRSATDPGLERGSKRADHAALRPSSGGWALRWLGTCGTCRLSACSI